MEPKKIKPKTAAEVFRDGQERKEKREKKDKMLLERLNKTRRRYGGS